MLDPVVSFPGFEVHGELGRGTTGIVYAVRDTTLGRRMALKVAAPGPDGGPATHRRRLGREVRVLASLGPLAAIPAIYMHEEDRDRSYYAQELIDGETLVEGIAGGRLDSHRGLAVIANVARTVQAVHAIGFVHSNLSPANVLVRPDGRACLIGFGRVSCAVGSRNMPPDAKGTEPAVDKSGLQVLLRWLCSAVGKPYPDDIGSVATAGEFVDRLTRHLGSPAEPFVPPDRGGTSRWRVCWPFTRRGR